MEWKAEPELAVSEVVPRVGDPTGDTEPALDTVGGPPVGLLAERPGLGG